MAAVEDEQLMFDENRLGDDGTKAARSGQSGNCDDQMEKEDDDVAHSGILSKPHRTHGFSNSPWTGSNPNTNLRMVSSCAGKGRLVPARPRTCVRRLHLFVQVARDAD